MPASADTEAMRLLPARAVESTEAPIRPNKIRAVPAGLRVLDARSERLQRIIETQRAVAAADLDPAAVLTMICERAQELTGGEGATIVMLEGDELVYRGTSGFLNSQLGVGRPVTQGFAGWVHAHESGGFVSDSVTDARCSPRAMEIGIRSSVAVPLRHGHDDVGQLHVGSPRPNAFGHEDLETLELLSVVFSAALSHAAEFEARRGQLAAERQKVQALDQFRAVFEGASIGIVRVSLAGQPIEANRAYEEMFGYASGELAALPAGTYTHQEDWEHHVALHGEVVAGKRKSYRLEKRYSRRDGVEVWGQVTGVLERGPDGEPTGVIAMVEDITERKLAEEQARQSQKVEAIGQLSAGIAHDFNNLLMGVLGYASLARADAAPGSKIAEYLERIEHTGERAASLTRQLLAFGRRQTLQPKVIDLNELVSETLATLSRVLGEHVEIVSVLDPGLPSLRADPTQLQQVLFNLALNARDAMPGGGVLTVATGAVELSDGNAPELDPGRYVMLSVSDTGLGMNAEVRERIFEPFFTTKEVGEGTGLGLPSVYGIVKQSNGGIDVTSSPGDGSVFRIYLPVSDPTTPPAS